MSKRKAGVIIDATALKSRRVTAAGAENATDKNHQGLSSNLFTPSTSGDIGLIESITLKNFMCHHSLGPVQFGPHVNFIVGNNGSGKSAILTALIVGLGGKATMTNRGVSLKDFVKTGENIADVTVKLRNRGADAYRKDLYGDYIIVEQRISSDGSRSYKLKNKSGQLVSNKKEELIAVLDHFNIQLDNPVSILSQEMSKQFLHSKNESDKYKFFMKATLLEQMKTDYIHIKHTETITRQQVERQEECLKDLRQEFLQKKERYESLSSFSDLKENLENLKKKMAWCLVRDKEQSVQQLKEEIKKEEKNKRHQENLQLCQSKLVQTEKMLQVIKKRTDSLREEQKSLREDNLNFKQQAKITNKAHKEQELVYFRALNKLKQTEREQNLFQEKMNKAKLSERLNNSERTKRSKQQATLGELKEQLAELQRSCSQLNEDIKKRHQALLKGKEERDRLRVEAKSVQFAYESKLKRKNQLLASRSNKLKRFGDLVPDLIAAINDASAEGRFIKKPIGPIGACISLKDPTLAVAVECCLRSFMKAFCCDNYKDESVLQGLMSRFYPKGNRPQIIVSPFSDKLYNVHGRKACHPDYPTVLDTITATTPDIINCLVDMRGIETILVIKEKDKARRIMQRGRPPKNCREAFTAEGDQVFPNRYYTSEFSMAKYLGGDMETEINLLESELENLKAHLSRFQLQVNSVTEDIVSMENSLNNTIKTLKKTQASMNQAKAAISELETANEEQSDDFTSLEEVAQENQQKIDAEKRAVQEAKAELDKKRQTSEEAESKYSSVRDKIDQLSEEMEPLKDEQLKLETERLKHERNLKVLEKKLKTHMDNIQAMKSVLSEKEEELQEIVEKATQISPERQNVTCSTNSIDTEITRLKKKLKVYESNHGEQEQVIREYAEALALYKEKTNQVRDLRKFIDRLNNIMSDRQNRYKIMRRSLSVRCKLYFNNFLIKMNCCGSMIFDHNNETLSISVKPPGRDKDGARDMRSLSGGERSFSTVCFMLSLWEITESPFRCLDEFDVYMDMHNRRICLDLLLELTERQHLRQFIFITPLNTSNLPRTALIKIHHLRNAEREDGHTRNKDM
ncbi:structural maintenance of chromosomes protein 6 [Fundulus heteroclitus]|uniref:structural maintenance of chromosomes protein 6 n=1 Tax=Fundulus heteroclitus TaxID=8078 RepID=UPI00165BF42D|nr:structural maintenance of chromosomes protein 6 [Fundulus heteroclitus]XP_021177047.2 structural maintenance of chromosomes protein 6 [Fundulus heteroclitus]XP_021177048.2 structural maintenance of chromosomes protein 6 [Fundulus heteroclitus]